MLPSLQFALFLEPVFRGSRGCSGKDPLGVLFGCSHPQSSSSHSPHSVWPLSMPEHLRDPEACSWHLPVRARAGGGLGDSLPNTVAVAAKPVSGQGAGILSGQVWHAVGGNARPQGQRLSDPGSPSLISIQPGAWVLQLWTHHMNEGEAGYTTYLPEGGDFFFFIFAVVF